MKYAWIEPPNELWATRRTGIPSCWKESLQGPRFCGKHPYPCPWRGCLAGPIQVGHEQRSGVALLWYSRAQAIAGMSGMLCCPALNKPLRS